MAMALDRSRAVSMVRACRSTEALCYRSMAAQAAWEEPLMALVLTALTSTVLVLTVLVLTVLVLTAMV